MICGDFNVHESSWLHSTHTSSAGTATLDFCESRNLLQLVDFPTRRDAILDLILSEHPGLVEELPCGKAFTLFDSYLSNRYIRVVTPLGSSHLCRVTTGVPQGASWSPSLFNLYIRQLPTFLKHSMVVGYADDHSL